MDEDSDKLRLIDTDGNQDKETSVAGTSLEFNDNLNESDSPTTIADDDPSELRLPKVSYPFLRIPWGLMLVEKTGLCKCGGKVKWRRRTYKMLVMAITFVIYVSYHLSRVSIGVVKSTWLPECRRNLTQTEGLCSNANVTNRTECPEGWEPFLGPEGATKLGSLDTSFLITYAICQFLSGIIAERTPLRYFLTFGMLGATTCTVLLGFSFFFQIHSLWYFIIVQIFGGIFQASGWPAIVGILGNWVPKSSRGLLTGVWNWHTSGGNLLGYLIPAIWAKPDSWGWSFLSAAFIMLSICVLVFLFLPTDPEVVGLKSLKKDHKKKEETGEIQESSSLPVEKKTTKKAIPVWRAFLVPCVMEYSLCLFNAKLVSYALLFWLPFYAKNNKIGGKCLGDYEATALAALFNVGFMISSVIIGGLSDLLNSRAVASMLFLVLSVPSLFLYREFGSVSVAVSGLLTLLVGVCVNGAYSVISTAVPIDLGNHKTLKSNQKAVSTISGIIDGTGSIGAAIGPFLVGWIVDSYGWNAVFYFLMVCFFLAALAIFRIFIVDVIKGLKNLKERYTKCRSPSAFQELNLHEFPAGVEMSDEHNSGDDPVPFSVRKQKGNGGLTGDTTITSSEETNL